MHTLRIAVAFTALALAANAQDKPAESLADSMTKKDQIEATIIPIKTLSGDSFERLVRLLGVFGARFTSDEKLRTLVVYAPKPVVAEMRRVIEALDRPGSEAAVGKNIDMTLTFLRCSIKAPEQPGAALPQDLEAVAKQLRAATQYKHVELWDVLMLRVQEGKQTEQTSILPATPASHGVATPPTVELKAAPSAVVQKDSGRYVRFDRLMVNMRIPYATSQFQDKSGVSMATQYQVMSIGLNTAGEFKEGQKSVVGKVSGLADESAVFVVVTLKVLD